MASSFGFSHTAPQFTAEDEEREIADLTPEDKKTILDDLYGRNSNELIMEGDIVEITAEQLADFRDAMDRIPIEDRSGFIKASIRCPELIETETDPAIYLRHMNYDAELAAKRIAEYWKTKEDVFGEDRAYLPMTQSGAMGDEETLSALRLCPHFRTFLPNDAHGRTVICGDQTKCKHSDCTRYSAVRIQWYVLHLALKRKSTIEKGIIYVMIGSTVQLKYFDRIRAKLLNKVVLECFPVNVRAIHLVVPPSSFLDMVLPSVKFILPSIQRQRLYIHPKSGAELLQEMSEFGLKKENLSKSMGGLFEWNSNWVIEQYEHEEASNARG